MQRQRIGEVVKQRIERTGKRGEETGDRERQPDMVLDRDAQKARATFILADRQEGPSERRAQQKAHQPDRDGKDRQQEIIERAATLANIERERAKSDRFAMKIAQTVETTGHAIPAIGEIVPKLPKSDRAHREIDAAPSHDQEAE